MFRSFFNRFRRRRRDNSSTTTSSKVVGDPPQQSRPRVTFNSLPAELRLQIWENTWEPRTVRISRSWIGGRRPFGGSRPLYLNNIREAHSANSLWHEWADLTPDPTGPNPLREMLEWHRPKNGSRSYDHTIPRTVTRGNVKFPVTLWINVESRLATLRHYELSFGLSTTGLSQVYFNFDIDTLEIPRHVPLIGTICRKDLARIKSLIIPRYYGDISHPELMLDYWNELDEDPNFRQSLTTPEGVQEIQDMIFTDFKKNFRLVCPRLERLEIRNPDACKMYSKTKAWVRERRVPIDWEQDTVLIPEGLGCLQCAQEQDIMPERMNAHWVYEHVHILIQGQKRCVISERCYEQDNPELQPWLENIELDLGQLTVAYQALSHEMTVDMCSFGPEARKAIQWVCLAEMLDVQFFYAPKLVYEI